MFSTTLRSITGHPRRFLATCTAVFLGVTFLMATLVLGDTVRRNFADAFTEANRGSAVLVRSSNSIGSADTGQRGLVDTATAELVATVDGVRTANAVVESSVQLAGADGATIGGQGPPTIGGTWIDDPDLNPYRVVEGRAPNPTSPSDGAAGPYEVVIDRGSARAGSLVIGSVTTVQTPRPLPVEIVGIATFGKNDSLGGTTYTGFAAADAGRLLGDDQSGVNAVRLAASPGVEPEELAARVDRVLPAGTEALTGTELSAEQLRAIEADFLGMMRTLLLLFAGIALLVATFSIYNTFTILAAQRSRESALLRAVGATRRQVLVSSLLEALAVGVLATAAGMAAGIGLGAGLQALLGASDVGLPTGSVAIGARSVVVAALIGVGVTISAAVAPAVQSSRVSPLAALRASAAESPRTGLVRTGLGVIVAGAAVSVLVNGTTGRGDLGRVGLGALGLVVGFLLLGPLLAKGAARVIGTPGRVFRGVTGRLAQENAVRNPRRTAGTATALMIGMGVVTLFTVFGASLRQSLEDEVSASFGATDLVIESTSFAGSGLAPEFTDVVGALPGIAIAAPLSFGDMRLDGIDETATVTDTAKLAEVSDLGVSAGSIARLSSDQVAVSDTYAQARRWTVDQKVEATFADGTVRPVTIGAVYRAKGALGNVIVPSPLWEAHATRTVGASVVLASVTDGADPGAVEAEVREIGTDYGSPTVRDRQGYLDAVGAQVNQLLTMVYVLLAVAVVIAMLGIANTLSLSIHERTRELGVLRAVGQTRRQMRSAIRWEAGVVAVFGTLAGLGLGLLIAWGVVNGTSGALELKSFAVPPTQLLAVLVVGVVVGVLASIRPARRAARIDVLTALTSD